MRIDELALRTGVTSRNIRAYQARGLLPPPMLRGRTGYYSEEHLRRLELIGDLQERGFSLEAIRQTLEAWSSGGDINDLLGIHEVISLPWDDAEPIELDAERLAELYPEVRDHPEYVERAIELGLLSRTPDGRFRGDRVRIEAGAELVRAGASQEDIFELVTAIRADTGVIAERFVQLVARRLIDPVIEGPSDAEDMHRTAQTVLALRRVAIDVVRPFLAEALAAATEAAVEEFRREIEGRTSGTTDEAIGG